MNKTTNQTKNYSQQNKDYTRVTNPVFNAGMPSRTLIEDTKFKIYIINSAMFGALGAVAIWIFYTAMMSLML